MSALSGSYEIRDPLPTGVTKGPVTPSEAVEHPKELADHRVCDCASDQH